MLQVVAGVVDQVPCDTVVEVEQDESKKGRSSRHEGDPALSVQVSHVSKPRSCSSRGSLVLAVIGPERCTVGSAAGIRGFEAVGNAQSWDLDGGEAKVGNNSPHDDGSCNSKVMDGVTNILIAAETGSLEATQEEDGGSGSDTQDDTQQGCLLFAVVFIIRVAFMEKIVGIQVSEETTRSERTSNSVQDENGHDQQREDIVGESSCVSDVSGKVEEGGKGSVSKSPDRYPSIKGKERNIKVHGHFVHHRSHNQDRTSTSDDDSGHSAEESHEDTDPGTSKDGLDGTNLVLGVSTVDCAESKDGSNHGDEHQKRNGDGLLVEGGHLLDPVGSDGGSNVMHQTTAPWLTRL